MIRIELPLPPKCLHPNAAKPASLKGKIGQSASKKKARRDAELAGMVALDHAGFGTSPQWKCATIQATYRFNTRRRRDGDNLNAWLKHYVDGLADAGVIADDYGLSWLPPKVETAGRPGVVLEIEPLCAALTKYRFHERSLTMRLEICRRSLRIVPDRDERDIAFIEDVLSITSASQACPRWKLKHQKNRERKGEAMICGLCHQYHSGTVCCPQRPT